MESTTTRSLTPSNYSLAFDRTFDGTTHVRDIVETADGGLAILGTASFNRSDDAWFAKLGPDGELKFSRTYGGDRHDYGRALVQTSDGGFAFAGETSSPWQNYSDRRFDAWLVKLAPNGSIEYERTFGTTGYDQAYDIVETSDGGLAIAGVIDDTYAEDALVVKVDTNGSVAFNRRYGGTYFEEAFALTALADGGVAFAGTTNSFGPGITDPGNSADAWMVEVSPNGTVEYNGTFGGTEYDTAEAVVATSDGGLAFAGGVRSFGARSKDAWIVKVDANRTVTLNESYGGGNLDGANDLIETADGGFLFAGRTSSFGVERGPTNGWIVEIDSNGTIRYNRSFDHNGNTGGFEDDEIHRLVGLSNGGIAFAGTAERSDEFGLYGWVGRLAPTFVVDDDGGETVDYRSIQAAVNNSTDGYRIVVRPGTYRETVVIDKNVTVVAPDGATLNGSTVEPTTYKTYKTFNTTLGFFIPPNSTAAPTISGFTITNYNTGVFTYSTHGNWTVRETTVRTHGGIRASKSSGDWTIRETTISAEVGIDADWSSGNWTIGKTSIVVGRFGRAVLAVKTSGNWTVENTTIQGDKGSWGIGAGSSTGDWVVRNTTIAGTTWAISPDKDSTGDWLIEGSTLIDNQFGVWAFGSSGDWTIRRTLIANGMVGVAASTTTAPSGNPTTGNWTIQNSTIRDMRSWGTGFGSEGHGIYAVGITGSWSVHDSTLVDTEAPAINATGANPQGNATRNWWGNASGPAPDDCVGNVTCADPLSRPPAGPSVKNGDVNADGSITSGDATLILRAVVGLPTPDGFTLLAADVNNDGTVTSGDATLILREVVGLS